MQKDIVKVGLSEILFREISIPSDRFKHHNKELNTFSASHLINDCMMVLEGIKRGVNCPEHVLNQLIRNCKEWSQTDIEIEEL